MSTHGRRQKWPCQVLTHLTFWLGIQESVNGMSIVSAHGSVWTAGPEKVMPQTVPGARTKEENQESTWPRERWVNRLRKDGQTTDNERADRPALRMETLGMSRVHTEQKLALSDHCVGPQLKAPPGRRVCALIVKITGMMSLGGWGRGEHEDRKLWSSGGGKVKAFCKGQEYRAYTPSASLAAHTPWLCFSVTRWMNEPHMLTLKLAQAMHTVWGSTNVKPASRVRPGSPLPGSRFLKYRA